MSVLIRHAVPEDAVGLSNLRDSVIQEGAYLIAEQGEYPDTPPGTGIVLVAIEAGDIIGMVEAQPGGYRRNSHVGQLQIMVQTNSRGRGIGKLLMARVIDCCRMAGIQKISLCVYMHNRPATELYKSLGFIEEGRRMCEYIFADGSLHGDILMALFL